MELAEKNYLLQEIKRLDKQIAGMSWCVFGFVLIKSSKKNTLFLLISLVITIIFFIPAFIYIGKCNKRNKLIREYVYKSFLNNDEPVIVLANVYREVDYGIICKYLYKQEKNGLYLNADKTVLSKNKNFIIETEEKINYLHDELIVLFNSSHYKSVKRIKEINRNIVIFAFELLETKDVEKIYSYCSEIVFMGHEKYNQIHKKFITKVIFKMEQKSGK